MANVNPISQEVAKRAAEYAEKHKVDLVTATAAVLKADPELARRYLAAPPMFRRYGDVDE